MTFTVTASYTGNDYTCKWYLNGIPEPTAGTGSKSYIFNATNNPGIYEVAVVVTKDGESRSDSCQVIVR